MLGKIRRDEVGHQELRRAAVFRSGNLCPGHMMADRVVRIVVVVAGLAVVVVALTVVEVVELLEVVVSGAVLLVDALARSSVRPPATTSEPFPEASPVALLSGPPQVTNMTARPRQIAPTVRSDGICIPRR